jgi:hypothetical protein
VLLLYKHVSFNLYSIFYFIFYISSKNFYSLGYRKYLARKLFLKKKKEAELRKGIVETFLSKIDFSSIQIYQSMNQTGF